MNTGAADRTVLVVGTKPGRKQASRILGAENYSVIGVPTCDRAKTVLDSGSVSVILCDKTLPCGSDWKAMLEMAKAVKSGPSVVVYSDQADDYLWSEALNLGAHDVVLHPFESSELLRVIGHARHFSSSMQPKGQPEGKAKAMAAS